MPERSTVSQLVQVGIETTPGTPVAATKKLTALSIDPSASFEIDRFRPRGYKFDTLTATNKESVEADLEGQPTYSEIIYPLSSLLTTPVTTQIMDGATPTGAYRHIFTPAVSAEDTPKTLTVEVGSSFRAHRFAYGLVTEMGLSFSRDEVSLDGAMIGTKLEDGITLTSSGVTTVDLVPILPTQIDVYMDNAFGGLGTTKLGRVLSTEVSIGDRYNPLWVLDSAKESWVAHIETAVDATMSIVMEADAQGMALLQAARSGDTRFFRMKATGPEIYDGAVTVNYLFQIDLAGKIDDVGDFSDADGVYAVEFTFRIVYDGSWTKALSIEVINKLAAL